MTKKPQHVQSPHQMGVEITKDDNGKEIVIKHLKPFDKLVYALMKRSMDASSRKTFVSIETIAKDLDVSRKTVTKSIQKLCDCGAIIKLTQKIGRSNQYEFPKHKNFEMFTMEFLNDKETLTTDEKAIVLALQEFTYKDDITGDSFTAHNLESLSKAMNISTPTLRKTFISLEDKGILTSTISNKVDNVSGTHQILRRIDNVKLAQAVLFIGKQVVENTNDIAELKQLIQEMQVEQQRTNEDLRNLKIENNILRKRLGENVESPKEFEF